VRLVGMNEGKKCLAGLFRAALIVRGAF